MNTKKYIFSIIAGSLLAGASTIASAVITFDPDGLAQDCSFPVGGCAPIAFDQLNLNTNNPGPTPTITTVTQYLGADGILGNGDLFNEQLRFQMTSSQSPLSFYLNQVWIEVDLWGDISGYAANAGGPTTAANFGAFADDVFDVNFKQSVGGQNSSIQMWFSPDGVGGALADRVIADFDVLSGGLSQLDVGNTLSQLFEITTEFTSVATDVWASNGVDFDTLLSNVPPTIILAITDGSVNVDATSLTGNLAAACNPNIGEDCITLEVESNNAALRVQIPEPATLALLGLGLVGVSLSRRRKIS